VHACVLLAEPGQPGREVVDRVLVRYADAEVVESGGRPGALGIQAQGQRRAPVGMGRRVPHQPALLDELHQDLVTQAAEVPLAGPVQVGNRQLTRLMGWDLDTYQGWLTTTAARLARVAEEDS
jgi:hypothetical protein